MQLKQKESLIGSHPWKLELLILELEKLGSP
jgi:hypothetical protein